MASLEGITGKKRPNQSIAPATAQGVEQWVRTAISSGKYKTDSEFLDALAEILAAIGNESLNSSKIVGKVQYAQGPVLDQWDYTEGKRPFKVKDSLTEKWVGDPRVMYIGRLAAQIGSMSDQANEYMVYLYRSTGRFYHSFMSDLGYTWSDIPEW
ncbi:hypothetical protein [Leyella stercorea]|uniref:hypothetical protein n=1 Tax=Leyella stercorea TaxID=363265 RepID=UPI00402A5202